MDQAIASPSQIHSFNLNESVFDLNKKRKLQADQFGLPISKHNCWNHRLSPKPLEDHRPVHDSNACSAKDETEEPTIYFVTEPAESGKDSNSFAGDDDCSMSESSSDSKFESNASKLWSSTATSALVNLSYNHAKDYQSSDVTRAEVSTESKTVYKAEDYDPSNYFDEIQVYQGLDSNNVEADGEFECFSHGIDTLEPFKSLNKTLHSSKVNPENTLLSTGSYSVSQDAESVRKPTIDQEFEQYFSMLML